MFYFDPASAVRWLLRAFPTPKPRSTLAPGISRDAVGCCPSCRDLIRVEPPGPSGVSVCPSCGRAIRSVEPLGPAGTPGDGRGRA